MQSNPYSLMFGKEPIQQIPRQVQSDEVIFAFSETNPSQQIYMISGVRGCGKTVFMTEISNYFRDKKDWITIELNSEGNLLEDFAAKLYNNRSLNKIFKADKLNLSFFGIGLEISGSDPITNIEVALDRMLDNIKKHNKRVLISIDEATAAKQMRLFASAFQIFVRRDYPLFLLMTGLPENIDVLQNVDTLTFLYRAPKIRLKPLNLRNMADNYKSVLSVSDDTALKMARLTRGYSFAFQVLGYYCWENDGDYEKALTALRTYLDEYVYNKIWSELSPLDKRILNAAARAKSRKVEDIRSLLGMASNEFSPYRDRLIRRDLLSGEERGYIKFTLPLFEDYVTDNYEE